MAAPDRDRFIPIRKAEILDALIDHGRIPSGAERDQFRRLCRILTTIYHYEYHDLLERLRHAYFDPDLGVGGHPVFAQAPLGQAYAELIQSLLAVLRDANFVELSYATLSRIRRKSQPRS
jgi:hypothetical protein